TTVARALCSELDLDVLFINASEDSGIDVVRTKIRNFASTVSLNGGMKVVILDEADYLNAQSSQPALRGLIEEFHTNCRFVFTANFKNRILEPIHSRCTVIEFQIPNAEKPTLAKLFFERCQFILDDLSIPFDEKVLVQLIKKHFPDFRRVLNELQRYSVAGVIDAGVLSTVGEINIKALIEALRESNFREMRKWVVANIDNDPAQIFRKIYDAAYDVMKKPTIPQLVVILADYQFKSAFVADQEINLVAALTEIMMECEFK
ncbi:unnamed protein product, partial [marine sediment metagenome]